MKMDKTKEYEDRGEFPSSTCGACGMSLPMANGIPMPTACLKCYPNGSMKQSADDKDSQKPKVKKKDDKADAEQGYDDGQGDDYDTDDGDDGDDDEEE